MDIRTKGLNHLCFPTYYRGPFVASNIATQKLPLGSASPVLGVMREGLNHLCFPTYYRGPFVASNIANIYCTECIIGIIDNAGTPSRLRFARTRRDEGDVRGRLATTEALSYILQRPICSVQILRIYDAHSLPRKDNRFDQELPSISSQSSP